MRLKWWKGLTRQRATSLGRQLRFHRTGYRRPQLERLESRWAPATHTWTGAASSVWSDDQNWDGGSPAADPSAALVFPARAQHLTDNTNDLANLTIQSLTITGEYTISGNGLTLNGGGITLQGAFTDIDLPITLGASQTWTVTTANTFFNGLKMLGTISGADSAGLIKDGIGTLFLVGDNTYTGTTTIAAGTLEVNGSQPGSNVIVNSGATLAGSGTVGTVTTSGVIMPSEFGVGILHAGNVTFNPGSSLDAVLGVTNEFGTLPRMTQLSVAGTVSLSGNPTLKVSLKTTPTVGDTFTPLTSTGSITGTFNGVPDNSTVTPVSFPSSAGFRINYQTHNVVLTALLPSNQGYVTQLYSDLLNRQPDMGGLTFWTDLLDQNKATRSQVALAFGNSPEFRMREVREVYQKFLHRDADPTGVSGWTQFLVQGHTVEQLEAQIVASPEYLQRRAGGNTNNFLAAVISDAFNRSITQADRSMSGDHFGSTRDRREVAEKLLATTEYRQDLVQSDYGRYLHRDADAGGLNMSVAALNNSLRDETLIAAIVGSPEYLDRITNVNIVPL
jgi:autotransporter-associated beta strand protein